ARQMRLDRPVVVRYVEYVSNVLSGDLGNSTRFRMPVRDIILDRLENPALLALVTFLLIVPLSMALGVAAGMRERSLLDRSIVLGSAILASIPEFALGVFLTSIFVVTLGWLPGTATLQAGGRWSIAAQMGLPVTVIVLFGMGYVASMVRASTPDA